MLETRDIDLIRRILSMDRIWSVYALGDLSPQRFSQCNWWAAPEQNALVLFYREFGTPVCFAIGTIDGLMERIPVEREIYLHVRLEALPAIERCYEIVSTRGMMRMSLHQYVPVETGDATIVWDASELRSLYADGDERNESPDFFFDSMVEDGTFFGVRRDGRLVAVAGTHLVSAEESVGAVGNVYVHHQWRGRGLGRMVTAAVVEELLRRQIATIALNVYHGNDVAVRTYQRLGFVQHCEFREGVCRLRQMIGRKMVG